MDTETGLVTPRRHVAVDDCGRVLNPMLVAGQQMGGVAQGVAQALWEEFVYDAEGQPITSSFVDYAMPSATEMPPMTLANTVTETPLNPLGAKGIGESATVGLDARRPERRRRRPEPPRRPSPRHAAQARAGRRRGAGGRRGDAAGPLARAARGVRRPRGADRGDEDEVANI